MGQAMLCARSQNGRVKVEEHAVEESRHDGTKETDDLGGAESRGTTYTKQTPVLRSFHGYQVYIGHSHHVFLSLQSRPSSNIQMGSRFEAVVRAGRWRRVDSRRRRVDSRRRSRDERSASLTRNRAEELPSPKTGPATKTKGPKSPTPSGDVDIRYSEPAMLVFADESSMADGR